MQHSLTTRKNVLTDSESLFMVEPGQTFINDDNLPNLPVPSLQHTLLLYLDSVRPHVSNEAFEKTEQICQKFQDGIGKKLQEKLLLRSSKRRNWLEQWWEEEAYLKLRLPLIPLLNMAGYMPVEDDLFAGDSDHRFWRAGVCLHHTAQFWRLLRREQLRPFVNRNVPWSMEQFRRLFNTSRVPGMDKDSIATYFSTDLKKPVPRHVVILCQGHIFTFDVLDEKEEPLNPSELSSQLRYIYDWCQHSPDGPGIGALTAADRISWAQSRNRLCDLHPDNSNHLETIDSALLVFILDDRCPLTDSEIMYESMGGDCSNRWADKSLIQICYKNGLIGGNADHAPYDGMVSGTLCYYNYLMGMEEGSELKGSQKIRNLPNPKKLEFHIDDGIEAAIEESKQTFNGLWSDIDCLLEHYNGYGKEFLKPFSLRPEGYVQMAIQAAYYKMYGRPAATYVTASTRQFYHGRTETCRSCIPEAVEWAKAMVEEKIPTIDRVKLLHLAIQKFSSNLNESTNGQGCDRHLFGLYMLAQEEGMAVPELYTDPSYAISGGGGNFTLSTSCSGYTSSSGGVPPMCENGYGTFYGIENHRLNFVVTAYKRSSQTDAKAFYEHLVQTLNSMQQLVLSAKL